MNWYRLLICLALAGCALARFVRHIREADETLENKGLCLYNDTWYRGGEELPTRGLCLVCHCFEGFKEPDAESCAVIDCPWDYYQKQYPGCTPVYADKDCCPVNWECGEIFPTPTTSPPEQQPECNCDWKYLKHYEVKGCKPIYEENGCHCPTRFDCPKSGESQNNDKVCVVRGKTYEVGESIDSPNNCDICNCFTDYFTNGASISCITVECPHIFRRRDEGCYFYYDENHCCPVKTECATPENPPVTAVCEYGGKTYHLGQRIYPEEDPCLICLCTESWTGVNNISCNRHDCFLERDAKQLKDGCIPIYHEKTCCPIEFYCGNAEKEAQNESSILNQQGSLPEKCTKPKDLSSCDEQLTYFFYNQSTKTCESNAGCGNSENKFETVEECQNTCIQKKEQRSDPGDVEHKCLFEDEYYNIGSVLDIKHPTNCVTCTCNIPPDFTCIHQSCPQPSFDDGRKCTMVYKPGTCCPEYSCVGTPAQSCPEPVCNGYNCSLTKDENGCSSCHCQSRCVPCPPMCKQEEPEDECSRCICDTSADDSVKVAPKFEPENEAVHMKQLKEDCKKMECQLDEICMAKRVTCVTYPCYPIPSCEKYNLECPLPACSQDCVLIARSGLDCPICQCENGTIDDKICPTPLCKWSNCTIKPGADGCPTCICSPQCTPEPCEVGCMSDINSKYSTCPCICQNPAADSIPAGKEETGDQPQGDQPKEHTESTLQMLQYECKKMSCPEGQICMLKQVHCNAEPCPPVLSCEEYKIGCQQPECPARCVLNGRYDNNCPICNCPDEVSGFDYNPVCKPPACSEDCVLIGRDENGCPICRCEDGRVDNKNCDLSQCLGYNCTLVPGHDKCPVCKCLYPCQPKECPPGCELDLETPTVFSTCACKCNDIADITTQPIVPFVENCPPVTCIGYNCTVENGPNRCPVCSCKKPCSPPACPSGCEPEMEEPIDRCPGCICTLSRSERDSEKQCPEPTCEGYNCSIVRGDSGCLTCVCESPCVPPRCPPQCETEQNIPEGRCPACICKLGIEAAADEKKDQDQCSKVVCPEGYVCLVKKEQCNANICPSVAHCVEKDPECPQVECSAGCIVLKADGDKCPSCYCASQIEELPKNVCPELSCAGHNCDIVEGEDGCPSCVCESPCVSPLCPPECEVERDVPDDRCPGCVCKSGLQGNKITTFPPEVQSCPDISCQGDHCREVLGADGCLLCFCDPVCAPPKCDPGCMVEPTTSEGACPGCICPEPELEVPLQQPIEVITNPPCSPVTCIAPRCQEIIGPNNCPRCFCAPDCSHIKCDPGCRMQDVPDGECPACVCETDSATLHNPVSMSTEPQCPPITCLGPRCREIMGSDNCPQCFCEPECAKPVCDPGCTIQERVPDGECPTCVCRTETTRKTTEVTAHTSFHSPLTTPNDFTTPPPPTCPPVKCAGLRCRNVTEKDGCVKCVCQLKCPVPKCTGRCYPEQDPPAGRCAGCICPSPQNG